MDGDGDIDVLGAALFDDEIAWWENRTIHRNAVFSDRHVIDEAFWSPHSMYAADLDGDGSADIIGAAFGDDEIAWWQNPGGADVTNGSAWSRYTLGDSFGGAVSVHATDVDGDGDVDVIGGALNHHTVAWWQNPGGTATTDGTPWTQYTLDNSFSLTQSIHAADVDGDGDADILGAASAINEFAWWENPGEPSVTNPLAWTKHTLNGSINGASRLTAADVDGDGDLDILGAEGGDDEIGWWENPGGVAATDGSPWSEHTVSASFDRADSLYAADIDADGDVDILGAAHNDGIAWWENPGGLATTDGTPWPEHVLDDSFDRAREVYASDVDGDGDSDILGVNLTFSDDLAWWENPGGLATTDGTPWVKHVPATRALSLYPADLDGDGDVDIVLGDTGGLFLPDVSWLENRGGQFGLPTVSLVPTETTSPGEQAVLQIDGVHNGRAGDTDVELVTFELLFDDGATPLTDAQANSVIENLYVYLDDGSGDFDPADTLVDTVSSLSLTNGVQQFMFADGNTDAQVMHGASRRYFVVLDLLAGGLLDLVRVTHLTESSSQAEDRDHDIPLKIEFSSNVSATTIVSQEEGVCPAEVVRANMTLTGTQVLQASVGATLGANLVVDGDDVSVVAPVVSIVGGTSISGPFSIGTSPACP